METTDNSYKIPEESFGIYRGVAPTDDTPLVPMGELELTINAQEVIIKFATGIEVDTYTYETDRIREVDLQYYKELCGDEHGKLLKAYLFPDGTSFVFFDVKPDSTDFSAAFVGAEEPSLLYSPKQVENGLFDKFIEEMEYQCEGRCLPRLKYDGKIDPE